MSITADAVHKISYKDIFTKFSIENMSLGNTSAATDNKQFPFCQVYLKYLQK